MKIKQTKQCMKLSIVISALIFLACSCTMQKRGCKSVRYMSGYSYVPTCPTMEQANRTHYYGGWLHNKTTGLVLILDRDCKVICFYHVKPENKLP